MHGGRCLARARCCGRLGARDQQEPAQEHDRDRRRDVTAMECLRPSREAGHVCGATSGRE